MKKVTGIGGIFFLTSDVDKMSAWYKKHLGINVKPGGYSSFEWQGKDNPGETGYTVWSLMDENSGYFNPSTERFMVNYRVENLEELLKQLKDEGVEVIDKIEKFEYGKFGWIIDPEGRKIELWEPVKRYKFED